MMHWLEKATPYPDRNFKYHLTFEKKSGIAFTKY